MASSFIGLIKLKIIQKKNLYKKENTKTRTRSPWLLPALSSFASPLCYTIHKDLHQNAIHGRPSTSTPLLGYPENDLHNPNSPLYFPCVFPFPLVDQLLYNCFGVCFFLSLLHSFPFLLHHKKPGSRTLNLYFFLVPNIAMVHRRTLSLPRLFQMLSCYWPLIDHLWKQFHTKIDLIILNSINYII